MFSCFSVRQWFSARKIQGTAGRGQGRKAKDKAEPCRKDAQGTEKTDGFGRNSLRKTFPDPEKAERTAPWAGEKAVKHDGNFLAQRLDARQPYIYCEDAAPTGEEKHGDGMDFPYCLLGGMRGTTSLPAQAPPS